MSHLATAEQRARSLSELTGHVRAVANELATWGYHFTGYDGKGAAIMTHPLAGVVRIHTSPKSKTGARTTILKLAHQQLRHVGVRVDLPWRPAQPEKKEEPVTAVIVDKVKLDARGVGERIIALAAEGKLGEAFTSAEVLEYLSGKYVLPRYSGDPVAAPGNVIVSQKLLALEKQGVLSRKKVDTGNGVVRYQYSYNTPLPTGEAQVGEAEPVPVAPPPPLPEDVPLAPTDVAVDPTGHGYVKRLDLPVPPPGIEVREVTPTPPVPTEALEMLRGYFVGDLEVENELLREALTGVVAVLVSAAEEAQAALAAVGERMAQPHRTPKKKKNGVIGEGQIGPLREARLAELIEKSPHGEALHITAYAEASGLDTAQAGNALNAAVRHNWKGVDGHTISQPRRGYYTINDPA